MSLSRRNFLLAVSLFGFRIAFLQQPIRDLERVLGNTQVESVIADVGFRQQQSVADRCRIHGVLLESLSYLSPDLVRYAMYRYHFIKSLDDLVVLFQQQYGTDHYPHEYRIIIAKIYDFFWSQHNIIGSQDLSLPHRNLFVSLVRNCSFQELYRFAALQGVSRPEALEQIKMACSMDLATGAGSYQSYGYEYIYPNIVLDRCKQQNVRVISSFLGADEDGISMSPLRTGLSFKRSVFEILCQFIVLAQDHGIMDITISGGRELGHHYDAQIGRNPLGRPLSQNPDLLHRSHEMGNCVDFRVAHAGGLQLLNWMTMHSQPIKGKKKERLFVYGALQFRFAYHGAEPMGGHIHCWMG